jgi:RNA 2',3'-cyclic 3'-phosphodiesterase
MRLFVGIDIEPAIRERISKFVDGVRNFAPDVRWVNPETFHITLKFLGETNKAEEIKRALGAVSGSPVTIAFRGTGYFPSPKSARVFWVGMEADANLATLHNSVNTATQSLGFEGEKGPYHPHLTLARAGSGRPSSMRGDRPNNKFQPLQEKLSALPHPEFGTMTAHEFFLYESKLSPRGAQYSKIDRYALGS